jgi:hypothetical protein
MFGKTFPEDDIQKENKNKENENESKENENENENKIELRFDKYVKLKEYKTSYESVN